MNRYKLLTGLFALDVALFVLAGVPPSSTRTTASSGSSAGSAGSAASPAPSS